ncbi:MAG: hypothetical protein ABIT05_07985 [Chitinophagaceae bacterium]
MTTIFHDHYDHSFLHSTIHVVKESIVKKKEKVVMQKKTDDDVTGLVK